MKTDDLIRTLAADGKTRRPALDKLLMTAALLGLVVALATFATFLRMRPNFMAMMHDFNFVLKFAVTLGLALTSAGLYWRTLRPGAQFGVWGPALVIAPLALAVGVGHELFVLPSNAWMPGMMGHNSAVCLLSIPLLSLPILVGLLYVSRDGAPEHPMLAGAIAGLVAGGIGGAIYAAHCTDDSPLFVMAWYTIGIAAMAGIGALAGSRVLRW
ncbi:hypothetical protein GJW-30_1_00345 [Variibacter gotjawalensis]|uniref:DUF1109 domain-containing protein n=1 Tax=Variibacter gotjawalensis TaxID=1333996 RepID=A0A0S3PPG6_9BRAD|nr:NrsF family protein [Variibacter gotjawalensis]NIK48132.1 hypothetical protein [Variibacter gotjawalensis]RZS50008.1 hypothetical protein EV661_2456 [Variibacter gotjawalensis]BAT57835.1 hypothetical protein GJW-30_1_00345 [Variibacter gotjawalensis]